jgi:hypothetical protein
VTDWRPIDDADAFRVGAPVAAPIGQQLVANYDANVDLRVYQQGARVWFYGHSPESELTPETARGVQVSTHPRVWSRVLVFLISPRWVMHDRAAWVLRLHISADIVRDDVLLYVGPAGELPRVNPTTLDPVDVDTRRIFTLTPATDAYTLDIACEDVLTQKAQTEAGDHYEIGVWMLSRETETEETVRFIDASSDGFTLSAQGDLAKPIKPHAALVSFARDAGVTVAPDFPVSDQQNVYHVLQSAPSIDGTLESRLGNTRLVVWPALTGSLSDRIRTFAGSFAAVVATFRELSYAQVYAANLEIVPRVLAGALPRQFGAVWFSVAKPPHVWEDTAATVPAAQFSPLRRFDDLSSGGTRPLLRAAGNVRLGSEGAYSTAAGLGSGQMFTAADATLDPNAIRSWEWWERTPDNAIVNTTNILGMAIVPGGTAARRSGVRREWDGTAQTMTYRIYNDGTAGSGSTMGVVPTPRGSIRHVVAVYDTAASAPQPWTLYIDGVAFNTGTNTRVPASEPDFRICHQILPPTEEGFLNGSRFLGGAIYTAALSADQVRLLHEARWYRHV